MSDLPTLSSDIGSLKSTLDVDDDADALLAPSPRETMQGAQNAISLIDQGFENAMARFS